jgi:hypothetical protein
MITLNVIALFYYFLLTTFVSTAFALTTLDVTASPAKTTNITNIIILMNIVRI